MTDPEHLARRTGAAASLFVHPAAFQVVNLARRMSQDAAALAVLITAGICWERVVNGDRIVPPAAWKGSGHVRWLAEHQAHRFFPVLVAAAVFVAVRRVGTGFIDWSDPHWWHDLVKPKLLRLAAVAGAAWYLWHVPGTLPGRYGPLVASVALALLLRRAGQAASGGLRQTTAAGFRPSLRASLDPQARIRLHNVDLADPGLPGVTTNLVGGSHDIFDEAAAFFLDRGDRRTAGYCIARAVEYELRNGHLANAERRCRAAAEPTGPHDEPAVLATRAQFSWTIGDRATAARLLRRAQQRLGTRIPIELTALRVDVLLDPDWSPDGEDVPAHRFSDWQRAAAVWRNRPGVVALNLVAQAQVLTRTNPQKALALAYQVPRLRDRVGRDDDLPTAEVLRMQRASGLALIVAAGLHERDGRPADASAAYLDAHDRLGSGLITPDTRRAASCLIRGCCCAIAAGYRDPAQENHALDLIRAGLQAMENTRASLPGPSSRAAWSAAERRLYSRAFELLTDSIGSQFDKAAELGAWLVESMHRSAIADQIAAKAIGDDAALAAAIAEAVAAERDIRLEEDDLERLAEVVPKLVRRSWAEVAEQVGLLREAATLLAVDHDAVRRRLGDRVALLYHCLRTPQGWTFHTAMITGDGRVTLRLSTLREHPGDEHRAFFQTPVGVLDAIADGDPKRLKLVYQGVRLDKPQWRQIAEAVFPPQLQQELHAAKGPDGRAELLIVPDGPIGGLPLAGLPVSQTVDGTSGLLIEHAEFSLVPALSMLAEPQPADVERDDAAPRGGNATPVAVVHLDDQLPGTAAEATRWQRLAGQMTVRLAANLDELRDALGGSPRPHVAAISAHGGLGDAMFDRAVRLRGGSILSAAAALDLPWPPTVVLATCWVTAVTVQIGQEPFGFPTACLLRGASTVLGGVAPITDSGSARILDGVYAALPSAVPAATSLRDTIRARLGSGAGADARPSEWAALTTWTIRPASRPSRASTAGYWGSDGLPRTEVVSGGVVTPDGPLSTGLLRALDAAARLAAGRPVGTIETLFGAFETDSARWAAPVADHQLRPAPHHIFGGEGTTGTVTARLGDRELPVSAALAGALRRAERVDRHLGHPAIETTTLLFCALVDEDTSAARWLRGHGIHGSAFIEHVATVALGPDWDDDRIAGLLTGATLDAHEERHDRLMAGADLDDSELLSTARGRRGKVWVAAVVVVALLLLGSAINTVPRDNPAATASGQAAQPGSLGVSVRTDPSAGAVISAVTPGSPADLAGLRIGDTIASVAGAPTPTAPDVIRAVRSHPAGIRITVRVVRAGRQLDYDLTLAHARSTP